MAILNNDWEFNKLNIYNYKIKGCYEKYFNFLKNNYKKFNGDIVESGVYRGHTLLSTALLLKELGSDKIVYGFDSFEGFPPLLNKNDQIPKFDNLYKNKLITKHHLESVKKNILLNKIFQKKNLNSHSISKSDNFSSTSLNDIKKKIKFLKLDNIVLVKGMFKTTMANRTIPKKIFACFVDCDLYESYLSTFKFVWPKLEKGGYLQLDEYYSLKFPGARIASNEFFSDKDVKINKYFSSKTDIFERWSIIKK